MTIRYVDRPDMPETFADSIASTYFDGQTLRIEFTVTRVDEAAAVAPITAHRFPVCRMVVPAAAGVDLINRLNQDRRRTSTGRRGEADTAANGSAQGNLTQRRTLGLRAMPFVICSFFY